MATATDSDRARNRRARATIRASKLRAEQSPNVVEADLWGYEESFLECRDLGHVWTVVGYYRAGGEVRRSLQCRRCPTASTDVWTPNGGRVGRRYNYADGYLMKGAHIDRGMVRVETLRRVTIFASEQDMTAALFASTKPRQIRSAS